MEQQSINVTSQEQAIAWPQGSQPCDVFRQLYASQRPYLRPLVIANDEEEVSTPHADRKELALYVLSQAFDGSLSPTFKVLTIIYYRADPQADTYTHGQKQRLLYHVYGEETNPSAHSCPVSILALLEPTDHPVAQLWRNACWKFWQNKVSRRRVKHVGFSFLQAVQNAPRKMIVCSSGGYLYVFSWMIDKPTHDQDISPAWIVRQSISWGIKIDARRQEDDVTPSSVQDAVRALAVRDVPLDDGWFLL